MSKRTIFKSLSVLLVCAMMLLCMVGCGATQEQVEKAVDSAAEANQAKLDDLIQALKDRGESDAATDAAMQAKIDALVHDLKELGELDAAMQTKIDALIQALKDRGEENAAQHNELLNRLEKLEQQNKALMLKLYGYEYDEQTATYRIHTEEGLHNAVSDAAGKTATLRLLTDLALTRTFTVSSGNITLDLNGYDLYPADTFAAVSTLWVESEDDENRTVLTVTDSTEDGYGCITGVYNAVALFNATLNLKGGSVAAYADDTLGYAMAIYGGNADICIDGGQINAMGYGTVSSGAIGINAYGGTLTVNDVILSVSAGAEDGSYAYGIAVQEGVTVINGGDLSAYTSDGSMKTIASVVAAVGGKLTVNGGDITAVVLNEESESYADCVTLSATSSEDSLTITGGTLNCGDKSYTVSVSGDAAPTIAISGGFFGGDLGIEVGICTVTGGEFCSDPTEFVDTERYTVETEQDYYIVSPKEH